MGISRRYWRQLRLSIHLKQDKFAGAPVSKTPTLLSPLRKTPKQDSSEIRRRPHATRLTPLPLRIQFTRRRCQFFKQDGGMRGSGGHTCRRQKGSRPRATTSPIGTVRQQMAIAIAKVLFNFSLSSRASADFLPPHPSGFSWPYVKPHALQKSHLPRRAFSPAGPPPRTARPIVHCRHRAEESSCFPRNLKSPDSRVPWPGPAVYHSGRGMHSATTTPTWTSRRSGASRAQKGLGLMS